MESELLSQTDQDEAHTVKNAGLLLGLSERTVWRLLDDDKLEAIRVSPGRITIFQSAIDEYKKRNRYRKAAQTAA